MQASIVEKAGHRRMGVGLARSAQAIVSVVFVLFLFQLGCQSEEERVAKLMARIEKLEARVAKTAAARALLGDVEVVEAQFLPRVENRPGTTEFRVTINNKTEHLISRMRFRAVVEVPGSSKQLMKGTIDSNTPGALEPGETTSFVMVPVTDTQWGRLDPPNGAVLRLTPTRVIGIGGVTLAEVGSPERAAKAESRLASLRAELGEIQSVR